MSSLIIDSTAITAVECLRLLRGAGLMCPVIMMIGAHTVVSGECQSTTPQVAAIKPDESLYGLFDLSTRSVKSASVCVRSDPAA